MNSPATAPATPASSALATACPRDRQPRNDYFCVTFCAYCLPRDVDGDSFACSFGEPGLPGAELAPILPGDELWEWWA
jgi:hypothetical protein